MLKKVLASTDYLPLKGISNVENYPFYTIIQMKTLNIKKPLCLIRRISYKTVEKTDFREFNDLTSTSLVNCTWRQKEPYKYI